MKESAARRTMRPVAWGALIIAGLILDARLALSQQTTRQANEHFDRGANLEAQASKLLAEDHPSAASARLKDGLSAYKRALAQAPSDPDPALRIATIHLFQKECQRALAILRRTSQSAFSVDLARPDAYVATATRRPKFKELLRIFGRCRLDNGPDSLGFQAIEAAKPLSADIHFLAGRRYLETQKYPKALEHLSAYLAHNTTDLKVHKAVASLQLRLNHLEAAKLTLTVILQKEPNDLTSLKNLAVVEIRQTKYFSAIQTLTRVLQLVPKDPTAHYNLGVCWARLDRHRTAIAQLRAAVAHNPKLVRGWYRLGLSYIEVGQSQRANDALSTAIRLDADHVPSRLAAARLHRTHRRFGTCRRLLAKGLLRRPKNVDMLLVQGACIRDAGAIRDALLVHQRAAQYAPNRSEVYAELGDDFSALNRLQDAATAYRDSLKIASSPT
ncbi:MAG: tetratricopeptide repeat protein, partial [Myxococcota bacterium]